MNSDKATFLLLLAFMLSVLILLIVLAICGHVERLKLIEAGYQQNHSGRWVKCKEVEQ